MSLLLLFWLCLESDGVSEFWWSYSLSPLPARHFYDMRNQHQFWSRSQEMFQRDPEQATQAWGTTTMEVERQYGLRALSDAEREMLISRLPPHYLIHCYANCFDRDERKPDFIPWTAAFHASSDRAAWIRDRSLCLRLGTQSVVRMMKCHLSFLSEQECARARAPYKLPKDILRQALWRVDPTHTGYVSLAQFMQVCCQV